ncbi:hypothetical protein G6M02_08085 [Agrobacterium rhizogenes]|nr:hypothetical protein [Rhizobium rhizogenes]
MNVPVSRSKFKLVSKNENQAGFSLNFEPVTSGSAENDRFFKFTPWGKLEIGTINADAANGYKVGKEYYLDLIEAE